MVCDGGGDGGDGRFSTFLDDEAGYAALCQQTAFAKTHEREDEAR